MTLILGSQIFYSLSLLAVTVELQNWVAPKLHELKENVVPCSQSSYENSKSRKLALSPDNS